MKKPPAMTCQEPPAGERHGEAGRSSLRYRPRLDLRWITGGIVAVGLGCLAWNLLGPEPPIVVSRETTFITTPLASDGKPDYLAAALALYGSAASPAENAAAVLLHECWPLGIEGSDLPAVCKALGMPLDPPVKPLKAPAQDAAAGVSREMFDSSFDGPWTAGEIPSLDAWMQANDAAIDRVVAAADRPRYWLPSPSLLRSSPQMLVGVALPDIQSLRNVSRLLVSRALWHQGAGRPVAAWRDIRAAYRLSRLLASSGPGPSFLVTQLVAVAMNANADSAAQHLLAASDLPVDLIAEIQRDLDGLAPLPAAADGVGLDRLGAIDAVVWIACREPGGRGARANLLNMVGSGSGSGSGALASPRAFAFLTSLDWNVVLRRMNSAYDELDAACRLPTGDERRAALDRRHQQLVARASAQHRPWWTTAGHALSLICDRRHRSETVGDTLVAILLPALSAWHDALARGRAQFSLTRTAVALAAWRADQDSDRPDYPERLDELVPRHIAALPVDPFSNAPFVYERRGDGYVLASVGINGVYDGGDDFTGRIIDGEWQDSKRSIDQRASDIVVRMPMPKKKVKP